MVLWVSASATDLGVYVVFRVLDPDGRKVPYAVWPLADGCPLSYGVLKVSHRATDSMRSTEWRPYHTHRKADYAPPVPDEIAPIHVEMLLTTARVQRGHRLQLIIEPCSNYSARAWRAYGDMAGQGSQYKDGFETVGGSPYDRSYHVNMENRIHTGPARISQLLIPSAPVRPSIVSEIVGHVKYHTS